MIRLSPREHRFASRGQEGNPVLYMANIATRRFKQTRVINQHGDMLIELLIAMGIATLIAAGVVQLYVQAFSLSNETQNQILAASLAQECVDMLRSLPYQTVLSSGANHTAQVTDTKANCTDTIFTRPLLQDLTAFQYSAGAGTTTATGLNNRFQVVNNQVTVTITPQVNSTLLVNVNLTYIDGTGSHNYSVYTILVQNGLNS